VRWRYGLFFLQWTEARHHEGLAQAWLAFEADPLSAYVATVMSFALGTVGRADEALVYAKQDPDSFLGGWELAIAYHWNGQFEAALAILRPFGQNRPSIWWHCGSFRFQRRVREPDCQRLPFAVMEDFYFGHIRTPSSMALVGYAVIKNALSAARFATAHVQRFVASAL
jgi:hypothetical protein